MLLCSILSAALAGGLTAYVQTITHINEVQACLEVPKRYHQTVIRHATERATQERILAFLEALQAAGKLKGVSELNSVSVAFNPNPNQEELQWRIDFEYLTFVHRPASSVRQAAEKYVKYLVKMSFNLAWREEKRMKKERNLRSISPSKYELLPICWYLEELVFWEPMYNFEVDVSEVKFLVPCSDHPTLESRFDQNMKINVLAAVGKAYARRAQWLIEQETDDWIASKLKELQAAALDENVEYESKFYDVIQEQFRSSPPFQPIIGEEGVVE